MKYKRSFFNIKFDETDTEVWLYNTLSNAMLALDKNAYEIYENSLETLQKEKPLIFNNLIKHGLLVDKNLNEFDLVKYLYWMNKFDTTTLNLTLVVTKLCNFDCVYCFEKKENKKLTQRDIERILKFMEKQLPGRKNLSIGWFGGEPLLEIPLILDLSSKIRSITEKHKVNLTQYMSTNGYFLTAENFFALYNAGITGYDITIDGPKEQHDKLRPLLGGLGTYDKIISNLISISDEYSNILKEEKALITIRVNLTHENLPIIKDWLENSFPEELKSTVKIYFAMVAGGGEKESPANYILNMDNFLLSPLKDTYMLLEISKFALDLGYNLQFSLKPSYVNCGAEAEGSYIILPDSKIAKCPVIMNVIGELDNEGNILITDLPSYVKWMTKDPFRYTGTFEECKTCPMLPICGGGCTKVYFNTNNKGCRIFKDSLNEYLKIIRDIRIKKVHNNSPN